MSFNRYGQSITWSTPGAPHPSTGSCTAYSESNAAQRVLVEDEQGDQAALLLVGRKIAMSFEARVTSASTDFLDLSSDAAELAVSGAASGVCLVNRAVERWALNQPKTISVSATIYPDITQASPVAAGTLSAFTPSQSSLTVVSPGGVLIYSTFGFTHASGIVHGLTIEQVLEITEDDLSPDGKILGATAHGYHRTISLQLLATSAPPAVGSTLAITGGTSQAGNHKIERVETRYADKRGKMYDISAIWIPPLG